MRIAIVNDLSLAREVLRRSVLSVPGYSVAWLAEDGEQAVRQALADVPDAILMDLVMPKLDGAEATRRIMSASPCPVLVVTATVPGNYDLVLKAMSAGAIDAVQTPTPGPEGRLRGAEPLLERLRRLQAAIMGQHRPRIVTPAARNANLPSIVAIGASTGGPEALGVVLAALPARFPAAVLIVQHIAAEYAQALATNLAGSCALPVRVARENEELTPGVVLLAGTNDHLELGTDRRLHYTPHPQDDPYRPSVDVLFASLAARASSKGVGLLLTGMGADGAEGLSQLRRANWHTIAQDEASCVVFGMPRAAIALRAAVEVIALEQIGHSVVSFIRAKR